MADYTFNLRQNFMNLSDEINAVAGDIPEPIENVIFTKTTCPISYEDLDAIVQEVGLQNVPAFFTMNGEDYYKFNSATPHTFEEHDHYCFDFIFFDTDKITLYTARLADDDTYQVLTKDYNIGGAL